MGQGAGQGSGQDRGSRASQLAVAETMLAGKVVEQSLLEWMNLLRAKGRAKVRVGLGLG